MKNIILFTLLMTSYLSAQNKDSLQINNMIEFSHSNYSEKFQKKNHLSKTEKNYTKPWETKKYTAEEIEHWLNIISQNAYMKQVTFFNKKGLKLLSKFSKNQNDIDIMDLVTYIELIPLKIETKTKKNNDLGFSLVTKKEEYKQYNFSAGFYDINPSEFIPKNNFLKLKFVSLNQVPFKKINQIGEITTLGKFSFKTIEIIDNMVVILHITPESKDETLEESLNMINLDKDGNRIKALDYDEFLKIKKDRKLRGEESNWSNKSTFDINEYNLSLFKSNPNISLEAYRKKVFSKWQKVISSKDNDAEYKKEFGENYKVFSSPNKIENAYFYTFKYLKKEFELPLK